MAISTRGSSPAKIVTLATGMTILVLACLAGETANSAPPAQLGAARQGDRLQLAGRIAQLARSYQNSSHAIVALSVLDLRDDAGANAAVIAAERPDELMIPASNQKILTSAAAIYRLGSKFRFVTTLCSRGGDLLVAGSFDPTLGDPATSSGAGESIYGELDRWARVVRRKVGPNVRGDLILRAPLGDKRRPADWPVKQYARAYAAPVGELNFHNNCFATTFERAGGAARTRPRVLPESYLIRIIDRTRAGRRQRWWIAGKADDSVLELRGTVKGPTTHPVRTAVASPPLLLGRVLADRLRRAGVELAGTVRTAPAIDLSDTTMLARTVTSLQAVLERANKLSLNMAAECVFLRAGDGTWEGSARIMTETLIEAFALKTSDLLVRDGSGLSRGNRVTAAAMTKVLAALARRPDSGVFLASLPVSGADGTLGKQRRLGGKYRGRILAKTGYIAGVSCLSGYVLDSSSAPAAAFSIMINQIAPGKTRDAKRLQDDICRALADHYAATPHR